MITYKRVSTIYHSKDWEHLVEIGYITMYTYKNPCDGCILAIMIYHPVKDGNGSYNR